MFSSEELHRRLAGFRHVLGQRDLDGALVHTADNVYYLSGVPLLSEWGRPMLAVVGQGSGALIGALIEAENMQNSGLETVLTYGDSTDVWRTAVSLVAGTMTVPTDRRPLRLGVEKSLLSTRLLGYLEAALPGIKVVEVGDVLARLRILKSDEELALLRECAEVGKAGAEAFLRSLRPGVSELEVVAEATGAMYRAQVECVPDGHSSSYAYCQFGRNTLTPHLHATGRRLRPGDVVALNVFPVIDGYCVELERTIVFDDAKGPTFRALTVVTEAFEVAKDAVRPGALLREVDRLASQVLSEAGYGLYIRHGTGHAHGIMIGAAGREELGELRPYNEEVFQPRMATSIEPGIYLPELEAGFRHSDVLVVTDTDSECITEFPVNLSAMGSSFESRSPSSD